MPDIDITAVAASVKVASDELVADPIAELSLEERQLLVLTDIAASLRSIVATLTPPPVQVRPAPMPAPVTSSTTP